MSLNHTSNLLSVELLIFFDKAVNTGLNSVFVNKATFVNKNLKVLDKNSNSSKTFLLCQYLSAQIKFL